ILGFISQRCKRWFGSFCHDIFHPHRFSRLARLRGFGRVTDCSRRCFWSRSQTRPPTCARLGRVVLALCRCRLGVRFFHRLPLAFAPMTTQQFLTSAWTWNPAVFVFSGVALATYVWAFGLTRRIAFLIAGLGVFLLTLV